MTDALGSHGTLIKIGDGGTPTEVFTTIAELRDINGMGLQLGTHEAANQLSEWIAKVPGMLSIKPVTFQVNLIPDDPTHDPTTGLVADMRNRVLRNFQFVYPDTAGTIWEFSAYVVDFQGTAPMDGLLTADVTLDGSGEPTFQ